MPETTIRPEPRDTAFSLIRATALDVAAHHDGEGQPLANWEMYNSLTAALKCWHAADCLREDSLLLTEWLACELIAYVYQQLGQDRDRLDNWLRDHGDQVSQAQQHAHPAGPTTVEIMSVVAEDFAARPAGPGSQARLLRIAAPYLLYLREGQEVEDAREVALTLALWAGQQLAVLMGHDGERIKSYTDTRTR
ncbi:hypothetical protein E4N62_20060 [Streptomyces sp. MNU76]|uniref:hypothetical protein n=1 Tax=Streptomyces sp. MNU76 TaxID=2560026 RepID=UPI001E36E547|nr:hypothetical protein [Streptomyces sp. MNU76]MCC9707373.1 hypothetical protein [Streptomyces sp. MNU76]